MNQKLRLFMMTLLCAVLSTAWGAKFVKVTDASQVADGKKYILVCNTKNQAMGAYSGGTYFKNVAVTISNSSVTTTDDDGINVFKLVAAPDNVGYYLQQTADDKYIYCPQAKSLKADTEKKTKCIVTITNEFQIDFGDGYGILQYNASSPRFCTYTTDQTPAYLYVEDNSANPSISVSDVSVIGNAAVELDVNVSNYTGAITFTSNPTNAVTVTEADGVYTLTATASAVVTATLGSTGVSTTFKVTYFSSGKSFPWSEDFSSNSLDGYIVVNGGSDTKLYPEDNLAGGEMPELLIGKNGGSFSVPINLNGIYGDLLLTFKANAKRVTLDVEGGERSTLDFDTNTYTTTITVEEGTQVLVLTFSNENSNNVRVDDFLLEKKKITPSLSFDQTSFNVAPGATFDAPQLVNIDDVSPVTYSSSDESLAIVNPETGAVTIRNNEGEVTITASFAGNNTYYAASASYTIVIGTPHGTAENPYTVAEARAAIDAGTGVQDVYATGIVSKIVTQYNSQYGNITYNISDDGSEETDQLQAYRGKSYNGANFKSADDIKVGDVVVIKGNLIKYGSTYEFEQNNQLVSLVRPTAPPVITASPNVELAFDATTGEIEYSIENPVDGQSLTVATDANWISNISVGTNKVTFETTANEGEERTATITLAYEGAEDVTVTVTQEAYVAPGTTTTYVKVTKTEDITDGNYLIVYEEGSVAFDGSLGTLDAANNTQEVNLNNGNITTDKEIYFTINTTDGTIKSASGYYIGRSGDSNGMNTNTSTKYENAFDIDDKGNVIIKSKGGAYLRFNSSTNNYRFRYFNSGTYTGQKAIQLYKEVKEDTPFTLTISSSASDGEYYYATMSAIGNGNFVVPQGIVASSIIINDRKRIEPTQTYEAGEVLDGKEAYLIEATEYGSYEFIPTPNAAKEIVDNWLFPAKAGVQISIPVGSTLDGTECKFYKLTLSSSDEDGSAHSVGFYWGAEGGAAFAFQSEHKAFLAVPAELATSASIGLFDAADGIGDAIVNEGAQRSIYTLTGVRVDSKQLPKGIYIINGKKQVVK